eukprot:TRINITY_DN5264_c0_g1_i1.p1 TRINITY_DN5264_c0_g1~~TRINITY_DN5264_c0_g1_i1.p1  ORF type:complete len:217 (-),score=33.51 TRINITY_DN5264_c0_g1_i1:290-940(-)
MESFHHHSSFLKSQISFLKSSEAFQDSTLVCRNGVLWLNSLLTFLLFQDDLENIEHMDEDLTVFLPDIDVELIQEMLDKLLKHNIYKSASSQFSLIDPFQAVQSVNKTIVRKRGLRSYFVCKHCGKGLKRTKWEAAEHEKMHCTDTGLVKCLIASGSAGKCCKEFKTKEQLQEHMADAHKTRYSMCDVCNLTFKSDCARQVHLDSAHSNSNCILTS